ncbi:MAG: hypothetical protein QG656_595, partial [Candidatus Hydrogenedentes bacterium]|nr:hypothetical protein [Candidatus Hydrogenedentota bacterium]
MKSLRHALTVSVLSVVILYPVYSGADLQNVQVGSILRVGSGPATPAAFDNVTWDSPSKDSSGSMPLGNGDIGINLWVEENGDILFYLSKTDAWSENARLLKLGRIRLRIEPNPLTENTRFLHTLLLRDGMASIVFSQSGKVTTVDIWVDANAPVVRVATSSAADHTVTAAFETWRTEPRELVGEERVSAYGLMESPAPIIVTPDTVLPARDNRVAWFHRNRASIWPETMRLQGMGEWANQAQNPLLNRTFGGCIVGEGLVAADDRTLRSEKPAREQRINVILLTKQTDTEEAWIEALDKAVENAASWDDARERHQAWWNEFWDRSWIRVSSKSDSPDQGEVVMRGYALQRYMAACAGRGAYPVKFNGSIFTVDAREKDRHFDADYRAWGGPYWFQNTRLVYWPMPASGDFEMMQPLFTMFLDALPFAKARTQAYFGHAGAFYPETQYFWGAYAMDNYGWNREGKPISEVDNRYIRWYWSGALELLAIMLDYHAYTRDDAFARDKLMPLAEAILDFYDLHYPRENGKILFKPAMALETWQDCIDPLPEIAGLQFVIDGLLALPEAVTGEPRRAQWQRMRSELPSLPTRETLNGPVLAAAREILEEARNSENPELYAIFPYRLFGVQKPDLDMARRTFAERRVKDNRGWRQDEIQAAFLGLADDAGKMLADRFSHKHPGSRFPAFWGPNFDWIPDQDHGSSGIAALQYMLLQPMGDKILLLPAWPKNWDVDFKLHAPKNTVVEGVYRNGQLERLTVTPKSREQDIVHCE